jgi:DNA-binding SARP family transcriptional activator/tetratricopeptide (TPR) repeat protein
MTSAAQHTAADAGIEIDVLGGFRARVDGNDVAADRWPSLRAVQLVQLLSLADGHRLLRDQVVDALWPQLEPEAGRANLRKAAHHARQALGLADAVVLQGGEVALCPSRRITVDAQRFERLAQAALARGAPDACAEAARACGGELLPGARYEPWAEAPRQRLRACHLALLRAAGLWEQLAEAEPTDEPAHRELMQRALDAGNRPAAIRWYGRLRAALQALGVRPAAATEALYEECVRGLRVAGPPLVGRADELARIAALLSAPADARGAGWVVRGAAGIGKSAFCRETASVARERGWMVIALDVVQGSRPYAVACDAVERLTLQDRSVLDAIGAPARSVLAQLSPLAAPAATLQGPLGRHQVIGALRRLLLAAAGGRPVILQVDDAHLVDEADADLLLHLAASGSPVVVALALRPNAGPAALERGITRLAGSGRLALIELGPLDDEQATQLIALAAARPLDDALVARIVRAAAGNPFAALELARAAGAGAQLPADAREAITARLCDVGDETLPALRRLALAGDEFDTATVVALTGEGEAQAFTLLDAALRAGVLVVAGDRYRFRHELVRQALVEEIPPHRRLAVHRDAARRLTTLDAAPGAVAHHWLAGGCPGEAQPWLLAAAREAMTVAAFADAMKFLAPLLEHAPTHVEALRLRAEALDALGDPRAVAAYEAAAATAGAPECHDLRAKAALAQIKGGDPRGALLRLEGVSPSSVDGRLAEALTLSGAAALGFGDPAAGTRKAAEARRIALQMGDTAALVVASWAQAAAAHARGELHSSVWADLHETHHVPHLALRAFDGHLCITQRFLYGARPYADVIAFADAIAAEAQRLGAARGQAFGITLRGEAELLSGRLVDAEEHLALGGRLHRAIGGHVGEALSLQRRAELALNRGQRDVAARLVDEALDLARQTDIGFHLLDRIYGTRISLHADPADALAALEDAQDAVRGPLETCPGCRITFAVPAAIAAARARRLDLAQRYEKAVVYLAQVVMRLPAWHAALDEVRAHLALARNDSAAAAAHFTAAAEGFRAAGQPLDAARCAQLAGGVE